MHMLSIIGNCLRDLWRRCKLVNFADDSTVVFGSGSIEKYFLSRREAKKQLSRCASDFLIWFVKYCKDLHLTYSVDKTKCLFF